MIKFDFKKDYVLENDMAKLSPLTLDHFEALVDLSKDPNIWTYFTENGCGINQLKSYLLAAIEHRIAKREYPFIIFDKTKQQYAGMTRLYDYLPNLGSIKMGHTWYGTTFQGTGLNTHCKYLLFNFIFKTLDLNRIGFGVHAENSRSLKALNRIGVKKEGVLREFLWSVNSSKRVELILLSILKREWLKI